VIVVVTGDPVVVVTVIVVVAVDVVITVTVTVAVLVTVVVAVLVTVAVAVAVLVTVVVVFPGLLGFAFSLVPWSAIGTTWATVVAESTPGAGSEAQAISGRPRLNVPSTAVLPVMTRAFWKRLCIG
jgi:hypothetical protein